jgi:carboxymethylenebutenolidase
MERRSQTYIVNFSRHGCNPSLPNQILISDPINWLKRKDTMTTQNVTIPALFGGSFSAYLAAPSSQPRAGIVLIQEVLGVNKNMRQTADDYAKAGYLVLVPDLYWRLEPDVQLDPEDEKQWAKAFELLGAFDVDSGVEDLKATCLFCGSIPAAQARSAVWAFVWAANWHISWQPVAMPMPMSVTTVLTLIRIWQRRQRFRNRCYCISVEMTNTCHLVLNQLFNKD